jgi:hypothetical protein
MAQVAIATGDDASARNWTTAGGGLQSVINKVLWNGLEGHYALAPTDRGSLSVVASAFCITSGAARDKANRILSSPALSTLELWPGSKDNSAINGSDPATKITPNTNGFLLNAMFASGAYQQGKKLMDSLWGCMVADECTASGASWEYVGTQGQPGLDRFTSLAHP